MHGVSRSDADWTTCQSCEGARAGGQDRGEGHAVKSTMVRAAVRTERSPANKGPSPRAMAGWLQLSLGLLVLLLACEHRDAGSTPGPETLVPRAEAQTALPAPASRPAE